MNKSTIKIHVDKEQILANIKIPSNFKLYRYRVFNDLTEKALINDEIWGTLPSAFNDPYDSISIFHLNKLIDYYANYLKQNEELVERLINEFNIEIINDRILACASFLVNTRIIGNNQNNIICGACFSEKITNEVMWAHYSNNATGFALEYSYSKLKELGKDVEERSINFIKDNFNIFNFDDYSSDKFPDVLVPMLYMNRKYNMDDYYKKVIDNDYQFLLKQINNEPFTFGDMVASLMEKTSQMRNSSFWSMNCLKGKDWKYEREWRLLAYNLNPFFLNQSPHYLIGNLRPTAIYLGEKITEYNKKNLINIAKEKNIKIYQMYSYVTENNMVLKYKRI